MCLLVVRLYFPSDSIVWPSSVGWHSHLCGLEWAGQLRGRGNTSWAGPSLGRSSKQVVDHVTWTHGQGGSDCLEWGFALFWFPGSIYQPEGYQGSPYYYGASTCWTSAGGEEFRFVLHIHVDWLSLAWLNVAGLRFIIRTKEAIFQYVTMLYPKQKHRNVSLYFNIPSRKVFIPLHS